MEHLFNNQGSNHPVQESQEENRLYWAFLFLEQIAETTCICKDLVLTFDSNKDMTHAVIALMICRCAAKQTYNQLSS